MRAVLALLVLGGIAHADSNDPIISRLGTHLTDGSGGSLTIGDNVAFRALASQLGTALAPQLLTPADTLGFSGFQMSVDYAATTIDNNAAYWRALDKAPSTLQTVGFFARKGLWFPVPSFEFGAGAVHLVDSHIWTGQLYAKLALHEGYHDLPLPSFSVRGAVSRMMEQHELDLTTASLDVEISKHFGIGGTWRFDPFVGWDLLMIIPRSEVIDGTPNVAGDGMNSFIFSDQDNIYRNRIFVGTKLQYYVFQLTIEAQFALAGTSVDDRAGTNTACTPMGMTSDCDTKDIAKAQTTLSASAGFDF
ncbi:MAG: hypothetical protein QM831_10970 [Kofleriaceae bacterium]